MTQKGRVAACPTDSLVLVGTKRSAVPFPGRESVHARAVVGDDPMSVLSLRLPDSIHRHIREIARRKSGDTLLISAMN